MPITTHGVDTGAPQVNDTLPAAVVHAGSPVVRAREVVASTASDLADAQALLATLKPGVVHQAAVQKLLWACATLDGMSHAEQENVRRAVTTTLSGLKATKSQVTEMHCILAATLRAVEVNKSDDTAIVRQVTQIPCGGTYQAVSAEHPITMRWQPADATVFLFGNEVVYPRLLLPADWLTAMLAGGRGSSDTRRLQNYEAHLTRDTDFAAVISQQLPDLIGCSAWLAAIAGAIDDHGTRRGSQYIPAVYDCELPRIYKVNPALYSHGRDLPAGWIPDADLGLLVQQEITGVRMAPYTSTNICTALPDWGDAGTLAAMFFKRLLPDDKEPTPWCKKHLRMNAVALAR